MGFLFDGSDCGACRASRFLETQSRYLQHAYDFLLALWQLGDESPKIGAFIVLVGGGAATYALKIFRDKF